MKISKTVLFLLLLAFIAPFCILPFAELKTLHWVMWAPSALSLVKVAYNKFVANNLEITE